MEYFHAMQQEHLVPGVITYNALISAGEKAQQLDQPLELLNAMQVHRITPDVMKSTERTARLRRHGRILRRDWAALAWCAPSRVVVSHKLPLEISRNTFDVIYRAHAPPAHVLGTTTASCRKATVVSVDLEILLNESGILF